MWTHYKRYILSNKFTEFIYICELSPHVKRANNCQSKAGSLQYIYTRVFFIVLNSLIPSFLHIRNKSIWFFLIFLGLFDFECQAGALVAQRRVLYRSEYWWNDYHVCERKTAWSSTFWSTVSYQTSKCHVNPKVNVMSM